MQRLRKKTPQIIFIAIAVAIGLILLLATLVGTLVEGEPGIVGPFNALVNGIIVLTENVTTTISSWGYGGLFGLMLLESTSLPIPSEVVLPFAGYLVSLGQMNFTIAVIVATLAGIAGSMMDYYVGLKAMTTLFNHRILGKVILTQNQSNVAVQWFEKYGPIVVFFSRLIPGFRTIVSFPAGAAKMYLPKFLAYTTAGCIIWNILLIYFGYWLGSQWTEVAGVSHSLIITAAVLLGLGFAILLVRWYRKKDDTKYHN